MLRKRNNKGLIVGIGASLISGALSGYAIYQQQKEKKTKELILNMIMDTQEEMIDELAYHEEAIEILHDLIMDTNEEEETDVGEDLLVLLEEIKSKEQE